jgi:hypothetical protein
MFSGLVLIMMMITCVLEVDTTRLAICPRRPSLQNLEGGELWMRLPRLVGGGHGGNSLRRTFSR